MNKILPRYLPPFLLALIFCAAAFAEPQTPPQAPKPKIRAITAFVNLDRSRYQIDIADTVKFLKRAQFIFESRGYTVQTLRIATQPFPEYTNGLARDAAIQFFKNLDGLADLQHISIAIGPAYLAGDDGEAQTLLLADILRNTVHLSGTVAITNESGINWPAVQAAARVVKNLSDSTPHSEGNFRFAAIAGMPAYSPFFPAAYHTGSGRQFSIGLESAVTVTTAFRNAPDYSTARRRLIDALFQQAFDVEDVALRVDHDQAWIYLGLDLSPAPGKDSSIGEAIETLSKQPFGASGTLTAVGTITSAIREIGARKVGYSGLMLPILEDARLADRWNSGLITLDSLLSYSAVCGTGLDTIPLSGDISVEELARIIGDVASLSAKWNKPLSARLFPVSGKRPGDRTEFTNPNLINAVIQPLHAKEH